MKKTISTYCPKTREDISNPFRETSHNELLKKANVYIFKGNIEIKALNNGRIIVNSGKTK